MLGEPQERDDLSLVMDEFWSMLQSWGRHVLEDLRRGIPQGSMDSTQMQKKGFREFPGICVLPERFPRGVISVHSILIKNI